MSTPIPPEIRSLLNQIYYGHEAGSFAGQNKLLKAVRQIDPTISQTVVRRFLLEQPSYQKYKRDSTRPKIARYKSKRFIQPNSPGILAVDTMFLSRMKSNFNYALVAVDELTKKQAIRFLRNLNSKNVTCAFDSMIKSDYNQFPIVQVFSDEGAHVSLMNSVNNLNKVHSRN